VTPPWITTAAIAGLVAGPRLKDILASLHARLAEARQQGWGGGQVSGLDVGIAAGQKLRAMDQLASRHQVTQHGTPNFGPAVGRSSTAGGGP
jgi:hypothetical protein